MRKNVTEVLSNLLTSIRSAQRDVSLLRDEMKKDEAVMQLLSLNDKLLKIESSIYGELPKTQETIDKFLSPKKRPGRPKASAPASIKKPAEAKKEKPAPKKRGRKPKTVAEKTVKTLKKPGRRGRSTSKNYTENWIIGYSILKTISMFNDKQTPRAVIYAVDKVLKPILTKDDLNESNAAKQRGYDGVWATHLSDSIHRERRTLLEAGLIEKKAPTGVWQLSAKGKQVLGAPQKLSTVYPSFDISKLPPVTKLFVTDEKNIKEYVKAFENQAPKTRGKKAKKAAPVAKKTKSAKKKPGRPKGAKNKATKVPSTKPKATTAKKKAGRPKGSKNKNPKMKVEAPKAEEKPASAPKIKKITSPKTAQKLPKVAKPKKAKPSLKNLEKKKPGRPPKTAKKTKKRSLVSAIEKRMAAKDIVEAPKPEAEQK